MGDEFRSYLITHSSSLITNCGGVAQTESEHLATNEKAEGSSPSVSSIFFKHRPSIGEGRQSVKPSLYELRRFESFPVHQLSTISFRCRPTGRTLGFGPGNIGSSPFAEAITRQQSVLQRLYELVLGTSIRRFKSCRSDQIYSHAWPNRQSRLP